MLSSAASSRLRRPWLTCLRERGSASIEMVVLMPALFAIMFLGMQAALFYHAGSLAAAAAQEGARVAGAERGSAAAGISEAGAYVADVAGDSLTHPRVTGSRNAQTATVTVRGRSLSVVPGWNQTVTKSATVPVERVTQ